MKKLLHIVALVLLIAALTACSDDEPTPTAPAAATEAVVEEAPTEAAVEEEEPAVEEPAPEPTAEAPAAEEPAAEEPAAEEPMEETSGLPPAEIMNDDGGPQRLVGGIDYTDFSIPQALQDPSPALLDMVHVVEGDPTQFAPVESQILGIMTTPVVPPPLGYAFNLPQTPTATFVDVDNNGEEDQGVQIFVLTMGANINGGSYLEQLDQKADLYSYLTDSQTGRITEGSLLVYAADGQQGFPGGLGDDGILFTGDDPAVGLPPGYTVVRFGPDGFTFDRSLEAEMNVLESAAAASSDFSELGIVDSFNALIDELAVRYSFTDFRGLDWEAKQAEYLPRVEELEQMAESDANTALTLYSVVLHELAQSIRDAHVAIGPYAPGNATYQAVINQAIAANVGVNTTELDDGRIILTDVVPDSPAEAAGWTFGTEIVSIDGAPVAERIPGIVYNENVGTDEGQRLHQVANLLKFPAETTEVTVEAILPGDTAVQSFTLTPGPYTLPDRLASVNLRGTMPIEFQMHANAGYLNWDAFHEPEVRMAVYEEFLKGAIATNSQHGIILDMRGNGGGWDLLYFTMASYFFNEDNPVSMHWIDQDQYDVEAGGLVPRAAPEYLLSAPQSDLYYDGPIVVHVDNNCASSCEFFSQFLQTNGRATVIAQYGTSGAGAPINRVSLPGGIIFQYTKGRAYYAGTEEFNLEAVGVTPDIRVPTTEETELAKLEGGDPVLDEGLRVLEELATQALVDSIVWVPLPGDAGVDYTAVVPDGWTQAGPTSFQSPDQAYSFGYPAVPEGASVESLLPQLGITDPESALVASVAANDLDWSIYASQAGNFVNLYALGVAEDGAIYVIAVIAPFTKADAATTALLEPAIEGFMPGGGS